MACISNAGYEAGAASQAGAIAAMAVLNAVVNAIIYEEQRRATNKITDMIEELANRKLALARYVHEHAKKFWPYEKDLVTDAFLETKHEPDYAALSTSWKQFASGGMDKMKAKYRRDVDHDCLPNTACFQVRWMHESTRMAMDSKSYGYRRAEARAEALNDRRFSKQYSALGLGRGILNTISTYQSLAGHLGIDNARTLAQTVNGGLQALGYVAQRLVGDGWGSGAQQQARQQYQPYAPLTLER